jgi:hypothetical protein
VRVHRTQDTFKGRHSGAQTRTERAVRAGLTRGLAVTRGGETCFPDRSAFTMDMFIRLAKVRLSYATKLYST